MTASTSPGNSPGMVSQNGRVRFGARYLEALFVAALFAWVLFGLNFEFFLGNIPWLYAPAAAAILGGLGIWIWGFLSARRPAVGPSAAGSPEEPPPGQRSPLGCLSLLTGAVWIALGVTVAGLQWFIR